MNQSRKFSLRKWTEVEVRRTIIDTSSNPCDNHPYYDTNLVLPYEYFDIRVDKILFEYSYSTMTGSNSNFAINSISMNLNLAMRLASWATDALT